ncbi:MAG TPA: hypothetical protein VJQ09_07725 [Candidatus Limnocylindria bacterium]|nr:hypothetical protein [Candidatus Limnocylindria bacterium]
MTYAGLGVAFMLACVALGARGNTRRSWAVVLAAGMVGAQGALLFLK